MKSIVTLTMNPAIDVAYEADQVFHTRKIRARQEHYDPGGGGINVARVIARLGGTARAYYLSGGATGCALDGLLDQHALVRSRIPIKGDTRVSTSIYERETGKEFRLVPRGPELTIDEWQAALDHLEGVRADFLVASGSLPPGVPDDFYSRVGQLARRHDMRLILDTSGNALREAVMGGNLHLIKPSIGELRQLVARPLNDERDIVAAAREIVDSGKSDHLAVTMGREGAILASRAGTWRLPAVEVETRSAVGAGDSFLAAMVFALSSERDPLDAFRYGIAAGAAAVLTPGTDLCHRDDVERLLELVPSIVPSCQEKGAV
ncbi:1-phosphofructokinase family hexose kinase [Sphingobium sp.]|uniref:1-phosphofructokinase family hexose kinase n=1 Tax=Sphingobium sp. TaxID=1912891 RepID=UPI0035C77958